MNRATALWYVRWALGVGAWATTIVLTALGAILFLLISVYPPPWLLALFGAVYLAFGLSLVRQDGREIFAQQLGTATAAAGAALISGGTAAEAGALGAVAGLIAAILTTAVVIAISHDRTLQFLCATLSVGFYVHTVFEAETPYALDCVALATPIGLLLLLRPPRKDLMPTAIALLCTFPLLSTVAIGSGPLVQRLSQGGTLTRILHIVLLLTLGFLHWSRSADRPKTEMVVFVVASTLGCLLLPPAGSASMVILTLAFVIGSKPLALLGAALQAYFLIRYYYSLEMDPFEKSLLLMAIGVLLLAAWWILHRKEHRQEEQA